MAGIIGREGLGRDEAGYGAQSGESPAAAGAAFGRGFMLDAWYAVAVARTLRPGTIKRVDTIAGPVALARRPDGGVFALADICPHRGAQFSKGRLRVETDGEAALECPYHGWRFDAQGHCRDIPSANAGEQSLRDAAQARAFACVERHGLIWLFLPEQRATPPDAAGALAAGLPELCESAPKLALETVFPGQFDHVCAGLLDPAHTPFVHQQWFWRRPQRRRPKTKAYRPSEQGFTMLAHRASANSAVYKILGAPETEIVFRLPGQRYERVTAGGVEFVTASFLTPVSARATRFLQLLWWRGGGLDLLRPFFVYAGRRFLAQDRAIIAQQAENFAHETPFLSLGDADEPVRWYAALKRERARARAEGRAFANPIPEKALSWTT